MHILTACVFNMPFLFPRMHLRYTLSLFQAPAPAALAAPSSHEVCACVSHVYVCSGIIVYRYFMFICSCILALGATLYRDVGWRPEPCCCCCYFFPPRCVPNARPPRNCCVYEVYGYMIWRRCSARMHNPRCSVWHTYDVFICALRCVCGAR